MIVGATPENDYQMMMVAEALYQNYDLKQGFYSAFVPIGDSPAFRRFRADRRFCLYRLYRADWLLRFYGFKASEKREPAEFQCVSGSQVTGRSAIGTVSGRSQPPVTIRFCGYRE